MCGIAGMRSRDGHVDTDQLAAMNDCLEHRGPDESGLYVDGAVGLAHRRLSIIDPEGGQQPISNEDETVHVVFNGEIYNHRQLREELGPRHTFRTDADTEVLVHLYEEEGPAFVDRLDGMFAFALWDVDRDRLLLARDRMGIKPLLVADTGESVAFASELPAFLEAGFDHGGLDEYALGQYFALGAIPAPRTAFRNVRKVRPGERVIVDADGTTYDRYDRLTVEPVDHNLDRAAAELRNRVEASVEKRLMSDVPLGAFLSGGLDSSIVVGTMTSLSSEPVSTYTVGYEESMFDESWAARAVATRHGTDHHEYTVAPDDVRDLIPDVISRLGEPFADPSLLPTSIVARETRRGVKVALSGDGADELFAGYDRYRGEYYSRYYRALPAPLRAGVTGAVDMLPASRGTEVGEFVRKLRKFTRGGEPDVARRHFEWMRLPDGLALAALPDETTDIGAETLQDEHADVETLLARERRDDLARVLAVDVRHTLPDQLLTKVDLASMYNSLEVRVPFLDSAIVEYALGLPTSYKMGGRSRKRVLRRAFDDVVPETVTDRRKQGFDVPIGEWFKSSLSEQFHETITRAGATPEHASRFVDEDAIEPVYEDHVSGRGDHGKFLWSAYVFACWLSRLDEDGII